MTHRSDRSDQADLSPQESTARRHGWELLPTVVLRSAGFPWQMVERLACERTRLLIEELFALEARSADVASRLHPAGRLSRGQQAKLRGLRPLPASDNLPADWLAEWNAAAEQVSAVRERLAATVEADTAAVDEALAAVRTDPRVNDAIVCSSPAVHRDLARGAAGGRIRRQLASYAQRLASKSETMSFFGPINYGRLSPGSDAATALDWEGHTAIPVRQAHTAARVNDAVQGLLLGDPALAERLAPVRKTMTGPPRGTGVGAALLREADGVRTVARIASGCGAGALEAVEAFAAAVAKGTLTHTLCPPATVVDPLRWTLERIDASDTETAARAAGVRALLVKVLELLDGYPSAPPEQKLTVQAELEALLPVADRSAERGRFYNDRVIIHEAAVGTARLEVRGPLARDMCDAVAPVLDLLAHEAEATRVRTNRAVAARLGAGRIPLLRALRECADLAIEPGGELGAELSRVIGAEGADRAELDVAGLLGPVRPILAGPRRRASRLDARPNRPSTAQYEDDPGARPAGRPTPRADPPRSTGQDLAAPPPPAAPVLCSIDVLIAAPDLAGYQPGVTPLILGDIHDAALLTPWALQFHPDAAALLAERDAGVRRALGDQVAVNVISRRTTGLPPLEFPGVVLELGGIAGPDRERIGLDQLWLESDGERVVLRGDTHPGRSLLFHNGELDTAVHTALALPRIRRPVLPDLPHVPRLRWGNVVFSRRRWALPSAALLEAHGSQRDAERLLATARLLRERGLPDRFFAKSPAERKPVYVDTASPELLKGMARLAGTAEQLLLSETLPAPEDAWLRDGELRFASELRCVYLRGGGER
ncbi:lantibiotic dehydratase [Kitasatospora sp. NPDC127121]|uniref:lantibiotic dehydratase n=1 Tax=Kitasatospora sp. NPDC127121 TaxID=3345371 RepID=UPI00362C119F